MDRGVRRATIHRVAELYVTEMTKHTPMLPFQTNQCQQRSKQRKSEKGGAWKIKIEEGRG